jgi:NADH-quinone oxidoreductase subunit A
MDMDTFEIVFPFTVLFLIGIGAPVFMTGFNWFLNRNRTTWRSKDEPYECGLAATNGSADQPIDVKFYLVAMLFLAFDLEVAFLYPWAVRFLKGGWDLLWAFLVFLVLLESAYLYLFRKGALDWRK